MWLLFISITDDTSITLRSGRHRGVKMTVYAHMFFSLSASILGKSTKANSHQSLSLLFLSVFDLHVLLCTPGLNCTLFSSNGVNSLSTAKKKKKMKRTHWLPSVYPSSPPLPRKGWQSGYTSLRETQLSIEARKKCACLFSLLILFTFSPTVINEIALGSTLWIFYTPVT